MNRFVSITQARGGSGLRLACLRGVPSPWTEAAKGIFYVKGLACQYAAQSKDEPDGALTAWAGDVGIPVVAYENEKLRTGWAEILLLAERLKPEPALIPQQASERAAMFGLSHEICGEMGFGWAYRLLMIQQSLGHGSETEVRLQSRARAHREGARARSAADVLGTDCGPALSARQLAHRARHLLGNLRKSDHAVARSGTSSRADDPHGVHLP